MDNVVSSDSEYVNNEMSEMKTYISNLLRELQVQKRNFESTTKVPTIEPEVVKKTYEYFEILLNKLDIELDVIMAAGESIKDLDIKLEESALSLDYTPLDYTPLTQEYRMAGKNDSTYVLGKNAEVGSESKEFLTTYSELVKSGKIQEPTTRD